jgi:electron transport complex protein RnfG
MTKTKNVREDFVKPILVLTLICLVCSGLLAYVNKITKPIIRETEERIATEAMNEVLPDAGGFAKIDVSFPDVYANGDTNYVTEAYKANNGNGYVFQVTGDGYGGKKTMKLIVGVDPDGKIVETKTLSHSETAGMGSKTAGDDYRFRWTGVDASAIDTVDGISGATFSSGHYKNSMRSVFDAFAYVMNGGK